MSEILHPSVIRVEEEPGRAAVIGEESLTWGQIYRELRKHMLQIVLTVLVVIGDFCVVVLGSLAFQGKGPFKQVDGFNGNPSLQTCLKPAWYYRYILILKHFGLIFISIYVLIVTVLRVVFAVKGLRFLKIVPLTFLMVHVLSLSLDIGWLFSNDRLNASGSLTLSLLLCFSNCVAISCVAFCFSICGKSAYKESSSEFWHSVIFLNFMAAYAAWSLIQFFLSLNFFLIFESEMDSYDVCLGEFIVFMVLVLAWFLIENWVLIIFFNTIVLHYLVLVYYMVTLVAGHAGASNKLLWILYICKLVIVIALLVLRVVFLWRINKGNRVYGTGTASAALPEENPTSE